MAKNQKDILDNKLPFSILTDLPSQAEWHKRTRQDCAKVKALDELLSMIEQRYVLDRDGKKIALGEEDVTLEQAELLYYLVTQTKPILTVETGFDHGLISGVITAGHMVNNLKGGHVPIQESPKYIMGGVGFYTMERLKLEGYQIMEHESALVLPQMYMQELNDGLAFAYLNCSKEFDEQMMEYFYLNRLLNEGGIIAINTNATARKNLVEYIRKMRHDYAVREVGSITLVQSPKLSALADHSPQFRH